MPSGFSPWGQKHVEPLWVTRHPWEHSISLHLLVSPIKYKNSDTANVSIQSNAIYNIYHKAIRRYCPDNWSHCCKTTRWLRTLSRSSENSSADTQFGPHLKRQSRDKTDAIVQLNNISMNYSTYIFLMFRPNDRVRSLRGYHNQDRRRTSIRQGCTFSLKHIRTVRHDTSKCWLMNKFVYVSLKTFRIMKLSFFFNTYHIYHRSCWPKNTSTFQYICRHRICIHPDYT